VQFHNFLAHLFAAERLDAKVTSAALSVRNCPAVFHVMRLLGGLTVNELKH
jgi:hypothetical protein